MQVVRNEGSAHVIMPNMHGHYIIYIVLQECDVASKITISVFKYAFLFLNHMSMKHLPMSTMIICHQINSSV